MDCMKLFCMLISRKHVFSCYRLILHTNGVQINSFALFKQNEMVSISKLVRKMNFYARCLGA